MPLSLFRPCELTPGARVFITLYIVHIPIYIYNTLQQRQRGNEKKAHITHIINMSYLNCMVFGIFARMCSIHCVHCHLYAHHSREARTSKRASKKKIISKSMYARVCIYDRIGSQKPNHRTEGILFQTIIHTSQKKREQNTCARIQYGNRLLLLLLAHTYRYIY